MGHGPLKNMRDFKAVAADYEYYLTLSDEPVSVCLSERQMYILSVWNTYTPWMTRWYNTEDTSAAELATIAAEIEDLLMCGCGYTVPGPTFTDRVNTNTYTSETSIVYGDTYNTWNTAGQTVASIAPNLDYGTGDPGDINNLTCHAIAFIVNAIMKSARNQAGMDTKYGQDLAAWVSSSFAGLGVAAGAATAVFGTGAAVLGFAAGPALVLGLAIAAVGTHFLALPTAEDPIWTDDAAMDDVICQMQENTGGSNMTRSAFQNALTPNDFVPETPAARIAGIIAPYLADLDTYLQFMVMANDLYGAADLATMPECGCDEGAWLVNIGLPLDSLKLISADEDTQTYELKNYYTGNYLTGGALAAPGYTIFIDSVDVPADQGSSARFVFDFGTYAYDAEIPCEYGTGKIWLYEFNPGIVVTITVKLDPCPTGSWGIEYYGEIVSQTSTTVTGRGLLTPDSGGLYQLELKPLEGCLTVSGGTSTAIVTDYNFYQACGEGDSIPFDVAGTSVPALPGTVQMVAFSSANPFDVTLNYTT